MKKFYLFLLCALLGNSIIASPIKGNVNNGYWKNGSTWDKSRKPQNGDTVIIPAGTTIIVNSSEALSNVFIKVYGKLQFAGLLTSLNLNSSSKIAVYTNGSIQATLNYLQYIILGGSYIFYEGQVNGPVVSTSTGFEISTALPVKFADFTVTKKNKDVLIAWSTSEEVNANMFEVERSPDGANWTTIAYVAAVGNSTGLNHYSFTDKNISAKIIYYRIKEVDFDGSTSFTSVKSVKTDGSSLASDIKIASVPNKVILLFPKQVKGNIMVRFISAGGQIMEQQVINNPVGQVVINSRVKGNCIISLSNGQDINTAKQVIL